MIVLDNDLHNKIETFLNQHSVDGVLENVKYLREAIDFLNYAIDDISKKNSIKGKEFREKYQIMFYDEFLYGSLKFREICNKYIFDSSLDIYGQKLMERLEKAIASKTYFPVDKELIIKVDEFLEKYKENKKIIEVSDKELLVKLYTRLEKAVYDPVREFDPDFDIKLTTSFKENGYELLLYLYHVGRKIGRDQDAEAKLIELYLVIDLNNIKINY